MIVAREGEQAGPPTAEADRIVGEVLAGDTESFAGLVRLFQESVWRIAAAVLRDRDATENLVQQVFVDAYFHLDQYRRGTDFGAWLRTIALNRARREVRSAIRSSRRLAAYRRLLLDRLGAEAGGDPGDQALIDALRECRGRLPGRSARVIDLRYGRSLSFQAIAEEVGGTASGVQRMISRARLQLRDCIRAKVETARR